MSRVIQGSNGNLHRYGVPNRDPKYGTPYSGDPKRYPGFWETNLWRQEYHQDGSSKSQNNHSMLKVIREWETMELRVEYTI